MNAKGHVNFSIYSTVMFGVGYYVKPIPIKTKDILYFVAGVLLGSLAPDIDHRKSKLGKLTQIVWRMNDFCEWFNRKTLKKKGYRSMFRHGGITHTILVNSWLFISAYFAQSYFLAGFSFGYMTHLYIDHVTGNKLNMLYFPLFNK